MPEQTNYQQGIPMMLIPQPQGPGQNLMQRNQTARQAPVMQRPGIRRRSRLSDQNARRFGRAAGRAEKFDQMGMGNMANMAGNRAMNAGGKSMMYGAPQQQQAPNFNTHLDGLPQINEMARNLFRRRG